MEKHLNPGIKSFSDLIREKNKTKDEIQRKEAAVKGKTMLKTALKVSQSPWPSTVKSAVKIAAFVLPLLQSSKDRKHASTQHAHTGKLLFGLGLGLLLTAPLYVRHLKRNTKPPSN